MRRSQPYQTQKFSLVKKNLEHNNNNHIENCRLQKMCQVLLFIKFLVLTDLL